MSNQMGTDTFTAVTHHCRSVCHWWLPRHRLHATDRGTVPAKNIRTEHHPLQTMENLISSSDSDSEDYEDEMSIEEEEIAEELKEGYKKIRDELYQIRKRQQKPEFDPDAEHPRIIDLLRETTEKDMKRYDESSWEDFRFFCVTVMISGLVGASIYAFLTYAGMYEIEEHFWEESDL